MSEATMSLNGHVSYLERICPECNTKGSIEFQREAGFQMDLRGTMTGVWKKLHSPMCTKCRTWFPPDHKFDMVR